MDVQNYLNQGFNLCNAINSELDKVMQNSNSKISKGDSISTSGNQTSKYINWSTISEMMHSSNNQPYINHDTDLSSIEKCTSLFTSLSEQKEKSDKITSKVSAASSVHTSKYHISVPDEYFGPSAVSSDPQNTTSSAFLATNSSAAGMPHNRPLSVNTSEMARKAANFTQEPVPLNSPESDDKNSSNNHNQNHNNSKQSRPKPKTNDVSFGVSHVALINSKAKHTAPVPNISVNGATKVSSAAKLIGKGKNSQKFGGTVSAGASAGPGTLSAANKAKPGPSAAKVTLETPASSTLAAIATGTSVTTGASAADDAGKSKRGRPKKGESASGSSSPLASVSTPMPPTEGASQSQENTPSAQSSPTDPNIVTTTVTVKRAYKSRGKPASTTANAPSAGSSSASSSSKSSVGQDTVSVAMKTVSVQTANNTTVLVTVPVLSFPSSTNASGSTSPVSPAAAPAPALPPPKIAAPAVPEPASSLPDIPTVTRFISPLDGSVIITTSNGTKKRKIETSPPKLTFCNVQGCYIPAPPSPPKE